MILDKQNASFSITSCDNTSNLTKSKKHVKPVVETILGNNKEPTLKKRIKAAKTGKQNANYVIIGYKTVGSDIAKIRNIIIYNIPVAWTTLMNFIRT